MKLLTPGKISLPNYNPAYSATLLKTLPAAQALLQVSALSAARQPGVVGGFHSIIDLSDVCGGPMTCQSLFQEDRDV